MDWLRGSLQALGAVALVPAAATALAVRADWRPGLRERLGGGEALLPAGVWVHGASVGEVLAGMELVRCLEGRGHRVHASAITATGVAVLRERHQGSAGFAPIDHAWCVSAALSRVRPKLLALVETELWPSWIRGASERDLPVVVVSARLSDRSFPMYRRFRRLLRPTMARLAAVGARSEGDAERFVALGVEERRVCVTGDLKLAGAKPEPPTAELAAALSGAPVLVAGSTHPGEEEAAVAALDRCRSRGQRAALVLAPRRIERAQEIAAVQAAAGRRVRLRSQLNRDPALGPGPGSGQTGLGSSSPASGGEGLVDGEILVLDSLGELASVYACAAAAFVGGTLAPVGGHNVVEPLLAGCPVVVGPRVENVAEAVALAEGCGAGRRITSAEELGDAVAVWLGDPDGARARGVAAWEALALHRQAAARSADLIESALDASTESIR